MNLFEIGSNYRVVTLECDLNADGKQAYYESSKSYEVAALDGTLVKLLGPDFANMKGDLAPRGLARDTPREVVILNTSSLFFVRAEKVERTNTEG
jgi:hypothetical protein